MRIAVEGSVLGWGPGGIASYLQGILGHVEPGDSWQIYTNARQPVTAFPGEIARRRKGGILWRNTTVLVHVWRTKPDVFWAPAHRIPLWLPCPLVTTVHDLAPLTHPGSKPAFETRAFRRTLGRAVRRSAAVLTDSGSTAHDVVRLFGVDPALVHTVPLGVADRFVPSADPAATRTLVEQRWGLPDPFVLVVGTLEPRKGLDLLADLLSDARPDDPTIVFVGRSAPGSEALIERLSHNPKARLLGVLSDEEVVALYQAAACVAVPSLHEGFGFAALEALACGTRVVIGANAGALNELFSSGGDYRAEPSG